VSWRVAEALPAVAGGREGVPVAIEPLSNLAAVLDAPLRVGLYATADFKGSFVNTGLGGGGVGFDTAGCADVEAVVRPLCRSSSACRALAS